MSDYEKKIRETQPESLLYYSKVPHVAVIFNHELTVDEIVVLAKPLPWYQRAWRWIRGKLVYQRKG